MSRLAIGSIIAGNSSAAGFDKVRQKENPRRRCLWTLLIQAGLVVFIGSFASLLMRFLATPTTLDVNHEGKFDFPAITICPTVPLSWARTCEYKNSQNITDLAGPNNRMSFRLRNYWTLSLPELKGKMLNTFYRAPHEYMQHNLYHIAEEFNFSKAAHEIILDCWYHGKQCSYADFKEVVLPSFHKCYTFAPNATEVEKATKPRMEDGLSLTFYNYDSCIFETDRKAMDYVKGFFVSIHPTDTEPDMTEEIVAANGVHTKVRLFQSVETHVSRKQEPCNTNKQQQSSCAISSVGRQEQSFEYTKGMCTRLALQEQVILTCGCYSEILEVSCSVNVSGCHSLPKDVFRYEIVTSPTNQSEVAGFEYNGMEVPRPEVYSNESLEFLARRVACHKTALAQAVAPERLESCIRPCQETLYSRMVSTHEWPEGFKLARTELSALMEARETELLASGQDILWMKEKKTLGSLSYLRAAYARLTVYPGSASAEVAVESLAYPVSAFVSEVGGTLGFWIGFSIINVLEVIEGLLMVCCNGKKRQVDGGEGQQPKKVVAVLPPE